MPTPYVCAACGQPITLGRHKSGWRHVKDAHPDHKVVKVARADYDAADDAPVDTESRAVFQLVLQFRPWGARDFDELVRLEDQLIQLLNGDAELDGHALGSNEANVFILCVDPPALLPRCVEAAERAGLLPILSAAHRQIDASDYTRYPCSG